jgi:predicted RNase H-like HicB family nuclease
MAAGPARVTRTARSAAVSNRRWVTSNAVLKSSRLRRPRPQQQLQPQRASGPAWPSLKPCRRSHGGQREPYRRRWPAQPTRLRGGAFYHGYADCASQRNRSCAKRWQIINPCAGVAGRRGRRARISRERETALRSSLGSFSHRLYRLARCATARPAARARLRLARDRARAYPEPMDQPREIGLVFAPQDEGGYHVYAPDLPGLHTEGDTLDEATANAQEALALYVEGMREDGRSLDTGRSGGSPGPCVTGALPFISGPESGQSSRTRRMGRLL